MHIVPLTLLLIIFLILYEFFLHSNFESVSVEDSVFQMLNAVHFIAVSLFGVLQLHTR